MSLIRTLHVHFAHDVEVRAISDHTSTTRRIYDNSYCNLFCYFWHYSLFAPVLGMFTLDIG